MSSNSSRSAVGCLVVLAVAALAVGAFFWLAPYYSTQLWWILRGTFFWSVPLLVLIVLAIVAFAMWDDGMGSSGAALGITLTVFAGGIAWFGWLFVYNYQQDQVYAATIQVTDTPMPELAERAPYSVSAAQVRPNLGDIPGNTQETTFVPVNEKFATLVEKRGSFTGYETLLEQQIGESGRNTPTQCRFDAAADRRFGGLFANSLGRYINTHQRWVNWEESDAYGYCDGDVPMVVVPLTEQEGFLIITEKPAGVALYNGKTGALEIRDNAKGIPGPSYPLSLAADQRASSAAMGGFWDWVWSRAGWELPDEADSVNSGNDSEFTLATADRKQELYVTPLTGRGSATAISAISAVDAHLTASALNPVTVYRTDPVWLSPNTITERIRSNFGDVFAQQREAGVYELAPLDGDRWVATIGSPQNMLYRVTGYGDLREDPCLIALDGRQLRCGPTGNIGVATAPTGPVPGGSPIAPAPADSDLVTLSNEQLIDLLNRANQEAARRLAEQGGS